MERRLAAILAADVVGYTALMGDDETGTLERLTSLRQQFLEPLIGDHRGRVVKLMGDGILVEFSSVVDAVACALAWQNGVAERDPGFQFRIGINLGDVIVDGEDIHGDGVNVAARLESLADPGSIYISSDAYRQARGKVDAIFEDLGEQSLKNVAEPIQVYQCLVGTLGTRAGQKRPPSPKRPLRFVPMAVGLGLLVALSGFLFWQQARKPYEEPASEANMAFPLPDKPSIAVLPFNNLSEDVSQEFFADGMTEDLITDLSKISGLFVIARNSSFSYKGQQVKVRQVAEELGVRFVLEGSVRRSGAKVRINAQLIDATTGGHLWAERYDGALDDIFDLQDEVTSQIVGALKVSLTAEEVAEQAQHQTENTRAHDAYLQGWALYKLLTPEALAQAVPFFEEAVRLDPEYSQAHAALASVFWDAFQNDWAFDMRLASFQAEEKANTHLEAALRAPTPLAHALQARILASVGLHDLAVTEAEKAVTLDPNDSKAHLGLVEALIFADRPGEALRPVKTAIRLDPFHPPNYLITLGAAQFGNELFDEAAVTLTRAVTRNAENEIPLIYLAASFGHLGRIEDAEKTVEAANDVRALLGLGDLSLGKIDRSGFSPFEGEIPFSRFGGTKAQELLRIGLSNIPALNWQFRVTTHLFMREDGRSAARYEIEGAKEIDLATAKSLFDRGVTFIDGSPPDIWRKLHIKTSINLPEERSVATNSARHLTQETLRAVAAPGDEVVFLWHARAQPGTPWGAAQAAAWGYRNIYYFVGGAPAWQEAGYPVEIGD